MGCCVANNCQNCSSSKEFSFHQFPSKNEELLKKWMLALHRDKWYPTKWSKICSAHFTEDAFHPNSKKLKGNAVPTIFDHRTRILKSGKANSLSRNTETSLVKEEVKMEIIPFHISETMFKDTNELGAQTCLKEPSTPTKKTRSFSQNTDTSLVKEEVEEMEDLHMEIIPFNISETMVKDTNDVGTQTFFKEPPSPTEKELRGKIKNLTNDVGTQMFYKEPPTPTEKELRRKIKNLKRRLERRDAKCSSLQEELKKLKPPELIYFRIDNSKPAGKERREMQFTARGD